jgi:NADPH2:quinone reductase
MRATVVERYGDPDVLRLTELPEVWPGPGEVAVAVAFAGVNYAEVMARRGELAPFQPPFVPGLEVSGRVCALGPGVDGIEVGRPVSALTTRGGYAEVAIAPAALTYQLRDADDSTLMSGAAFPTIVPTGWALVHEVARLRRGESVLVQAAAGGVGTVAAQVARLAEGGRVLGVAGSERKAAYAESFGFDEVFGPDDWVQRALGATGGRGVDVVLDSIGGEVRRRGFEVLAPLGRLVCFGNASAVQEVGVPGSALRQEVKATMGWSITALAAREPQVVRRIARQALAHYEAGELRVDVTDVFPLAQAARAHRLIESRQAIGKLLLDVGAAG